jgi:3-hydroxyacyl-[acyl-carrier-protein] dehydratase
MDVNEIQSILPHRYPFLLVDRVVELKPGEKLVAVKNVTANEHFFQGHFPGHPVMPGVLILEALAQAAALLGYKTAQANPQTHVTYLMTIDGAKFRKPVVPGDQLKLDIQLLRYKGSLLKVHGQALVDGAVAAEADFLATIIDRKQVSQ